jgi:hypothetical protein
MSMQKKLAETAGVGRNQSSVGGYSDFFKTVVDEANSIEEQLKIGLR